MSSDIKLTIGSVTKELRLMTQDGSKLWKVSEISRSLGAHTGSSVFDSLSPDKELKLTITDWSGGMGQKYWESANKYNFATGIDTMTPRELKAGVTWDNLRSLVSSSETGVASTVFKGVQYFATNKSIYSVSGTAITTKKTYTTETITDICAFGDVLFVALGSSTAYQYSTDGTSYTASTLADNMAEFFKVTLAGAGSTQILWKAKNPNELTSNTNGVNGGAAWTSPSYVGSTDNDIVSLMVHNDNLLIGKDDALYHLDNDGVAHIVLQASQGVPSSPKDFTKPVIHRGNLYFIYQHGIGEITAYNSFDTIGVRENSLNPDDYALGAPMSLASDGDWLYACYYMVYGSVYQLCFAGKENDSGEWEWHAFFYLSISSTSYGECMFVSGDYVWAIIKGYAEQTPVYSLESTRTRQISGDRLLVTSWYDAGYPTWTKLIQSIELDCTSGTGGITIEYEADDAGSWTTYGSWTTTGDSIEKKYKAVSYKKIRFRIKPLITTAVIRSMTVHGQLRPERIKLFDFVVDVGDNRTRPAKTIRDFLDGGRTSTSTVTLVDRFGTSWDVVILPGYPEEIEVKDTTGKQSSLAMRIVAMEVDAS